MDIKCPHCGSYNNIREVVTRCLECGKELFNSKKENMNPFKVKDTVYHYKYGKGEVIEVNIDTILVEYEKAKRWHSDLSLISFTPYILQGFTQERPFEPIVGNYYWFWDNSMVRKNAAVFGEYLGKSQSDQYPYRNSYGTFENISDKNPLECQEKETTK